MGLDGPGTSEDDLWAVGAREGIREHLRELVDGKLEAKSAEVGENDWPAVERVILLRTIDSLWVEHLTELDDMRRGIGLRGYAQQDPLVEFRREAYNLYAELRGFIRHQLASSILRVQINRTDPAAAQPLPGPGQPLAGPGQPETPAAAAPRQVASSGQAGREAAAGNAILGTIARGLPPAPAVRAVKEQLGDEVVGSSSGTNGSGALRPGFAPDGRRMGRNDVCFCGSGLKYKKCHGR
jgi:preprotein translocase subunit SecA